MARRPRSVIVRLPNVVFTSRFSTAMARFRGSRRSPASAPAGSPSPGWDTADHTVACSRQWRRVRPSATQCAHGPRGDRPTTTPDESRSPRRQTIRVRPGDVLLTPHDRALFQSAQGFRRVHPTAWPSPCSATATSTCAFMAMTSTRFAQNSPARIDSTIDHAGSVGRETTANSGRATHPREL